MLLQLLEGDTMHIIEIALGFLILRYWRWALWGAWRALRHMLWEPLALWITGLPYPLAAYLCPWPARYSHAQGRRTLVPRHCAEAGGSEPQKPKRRLLNWNKPGASAREIVAHSAALCPALPRFLQTDAAMTMCDN